MTRNMKDIASGVFFIAVGLFFCISVWLKLTIGTALRMGPGYFPLVLGGILALLGLVIVFKGLLSEGGPIGGIPWRGSLLIGLAPVVFGATVQGLGLIGAVFLSTMVAALSSQRVSLVFALLLTLGLTLFCVLVFSYGLGLPIQLVGPWLNGLEG